MTLDRRIATGAASDSVILPFEARQKKRQRVQLASGREGQIKLARASVLRGGDCLSGPSGDIVRVDAALEMLSVVNASDAEQLARAAYHLGNRHVWVQVGSNSLCYLRDHVLDAMLHSMGIDVQAVEQPFEPEAGAYDHHAH